MIEREGREHEHQKQRDATAARTGPLEMALHNLTALDRMTRPIRETEAAGDDKRAADLHMQATLISTGRATAVLDDAARYAHASMLRTSARSAR